MDRYEGPIKAGMIFVGGRESSELYIDTRRAELPEGTNFIESLRKEWRPVRPSDGDIEAWARFLPDAPLPDTGPKKFGVGQVWAFRDKDWSRVLRVWGHADGWSEGYFHFDRLADSRVLIPGLELVAEKSIAAGMSVLLFDAPTEVKPGTIQASNAKMFVAGRLTGIPAKREPVAPWVRLETPGRREGGDWWCITGAHGDWTEANYAAPWKTPSGACEDCAEAAGVFGPMPAIVSGTAPQPSTAEPAQMATGETMPATNSNIQVPVDVWFSFKLGAAAPPAPPPLMIHRAPWKCPGFVDKPCRTPHAPAARARKFEGWCVVCHDESVAQMNHGSEPRAPSTVAATSPPAIRPIYLPDPSVYASPFKTRPPAHERLSPVVRVDLDDLP
jgi:hypothetical protein